MLLSMYSCIKWTRFCQSKDIVYISLEVFIQKIAYFNEQVQQLHKKPTQLFGTSIWDETLYLVLFQCVYDCQAWSNVIQSLVPDAQKLRHQLKVLANIMEVDEVVLFERNTFLVIASSTNNSFLDPNRFEKISNTIKQFKLVMKQSKRVWMTGQEAQLFI